MMHYADIAAQLDLDFAAKQWVITTYGEDVALVFPAATSIALRSVLFGATEEQAKLSILGDIGLHPL
jgi:hypothetical protein